MSLPPNQLQALRTAFQSCRPRSCLNLQTRRNLIPLLSRRQQQQHRHLSNESTPSPSSSPITPPPTSSVSQDEVSHFSRLASSWWDPHGPSRLLHLMNPLRHDFIASCIQRDPNFSTNSSTRLKYLDIGCGGGIFASSAARKPHTASVTAIDPTPEVIAVAKAHQRKDPSIAEPKLRYLNCAIEDLSAANTKPAAEGQEAKDTTGGEHQYDIITLFEVIEHISQPSSFLTTALQHLKPGGWLIGSTISRHPISYLTTILAAEAPIVGVVPRGTHDWNKYIKPGELKAWFEEKGHSEFGNVKIEGVVYVPLLGWRFIKGSEEVGNYFFGVQKSKSGMGGDGMNV